MFAHKTNSTGELVCDRKHKPYKNSLKLNVMKKTNKGMLKWMLLKCWKLVWKETDGWSEEKRRQKGEAKLKDKTKDRQAGAKGDNTTKDKKGGQRRGLEKIEEM